MKARLTKGLFYLLILPAAIAVGGWQGWSWWSWATAPVLSSAVVEAEQEASDPETIFEETAVQLQIPSGTSGQQIGRDLEAAGLIKSSTAWNLWTRWRIFRDPDGGYRAGTYRLSPTQPLKAIAAQLWSGEVVTEGFTVPEGWNRRQIAAALEAEGFFSAQAFLTATETIPTDQFPWLPDGLPHLEGFLYPDTYQVPAEQVTPDVIIAAMLRRFEQVALPLYQAQQSSLSLLEWTTLASIVEKESVVDEERGTIAGVFTNRLEQNIPLGADPTVEYGLGITQTPENPLTFAQVQTPNPYNTYINAGLPPTPIASPGEASLAATLDPESTEYLYFVARYDGTHVFSRTLAEHEATQARIRAGIESQIDAQSDSAAADEASQ
ncbi:MAG: endolytic transglycosylase MltG [Cyanobacteria bacterium P01_H01_bin.119]